MWRQSGPKSRSTAVLIPATNQTWTARHLLRSRHVATTACRWEWRSWDWVSHTPTTYKGLRRGRSGAKWSRNLTVRLRGKYRKVTLRVLGQILAEGRGGVWCEPQRSLYACRVSVFCYFYRRFCASFPSMEGESPTVYKRTWHLKIISWRQNATRCCLQNHFTINYWNGKMNGFALLLHLEIMVNITRCCVMLLCCNYIAEHTVFYMNIFEFQNIWAIFIKGLNIFLLFP